MPLDLSLPFCFYPLNVAYNHGIALLSALCKQRGIAVELCLLGDESEFASRLSSWTAPVVCFSAVTSADYSASLPYMKAAHDAGKVVILGGTWASLDRPVPDYVYAVCRGEGETLLDFLLRGDDTLFREKLVFTGDLNSLPLPDYEMFKDIPFDRGLPETSGKRCLPYFSSRGCPHRCTFCQIRQQPQGYRIRTRVEEDLRLLSELYRPDWFFIGDAQMPYDSPKWRDSWGEFRFPFAGYIRADIRSELLDWLIDRGMIGCSFGVESGDERYRNEVLAKGLTDAQLWRTVETLKRRGLWYVPFFMIGTPGEDFTTQTATVKMAEAVGKYSIVWRYEELKPWASQQA
jgi:radical SAM superfamily enzyme YgiQ (UPF0313 family)